MADDGSAQSMTVWPLPSFRFNVTIGAGDALNGSFSEVTGLSAENAPIEYRRGDSKLFSTAKMPGLSKVGNVTLKRGIFKNDPAFWDWYGSIHQNTIKRQNIVISLLDEKGVVAMSWTLTNAFPVKITGPDLDRDGGEVVVTTVEIAFETLTVANP